MDSTLWSREKNILLVDKHIALLESKSDSLDISEKQRYKTEMMALLQQAIHSFENRKREYRQLIKKSNRRNKTEAINKIGSAGIVGYSIGRTGDYWGIPSIPAPIFFDNNDLKIIHNVYSNAITNYEERMAEVEKLF